MSFRILGTGSSLPPKVLTNQDLTAFVETSDEWIRTRTGIESRHVLADGETVTGLACAAAESALADAGLEGKDVDFVLAATIGGDYISPGLSNLVQAGIGAECPALDVNDGCSGFLYALQVARGLLACGAARRILVLGAEGLSRIVDWTDRATCVLFGDGAAAVVLEAGQDLLSLELHSQGWAEPLNLPYPVGNAPWRNNTAKPQPYVQMQGQDVYKFAVNAIAGGIKSALATAGVAEEQVAHVLVHQANLRIIEGAQRKIAIPADRYRINIQQVGNTSACSIPLLLDECSRRGEFKSGDIIVLCGFGAGLTNGAAVLKWSK